MKPHYTQIGLDGYLSRVPLPLPLPPTEPARWTCMYALLGPDLAFRRDPYAPLASDALLRELLEHAGRPVAADESRELLLVTPITDDVPLTELLFRALVGPAPVEAARMLGHVGDAAVGERLLPWVATPSIPVRAAVVEALGRLGVGRDALGRWDGDIDAERLLALVRQGWMPDELPAGELEPLAGWIPGLDRTAGRAVLEGVTTYGEVVERIVATIVAQSPLVAHDLAEGLVELLPRVCDEPLWVGAIAAAGEEAVEAVVAAASGEDWRSRLGAVMVLGRLPESGAAGLEALRRAWSDDDGDVRREAALALRLWGEPVRLSTWSDGFGFLERARVHPWGEALLGGPVPRDLFALLSRRDDPAVHARACFALAFGHPELAAPALDALVADRGFDLPLEGRVAAAAALLSTGLAPRSVPALSRVLLRGPLRAGAEGSAGAVEGLRPEDLAAIAARDSDWEVRNAALGLLERTGEAGRFDALLEMLAEVDSDADVRRRARSMRAPDYRMPDVPASLARLATTSRVDERRRSAALAEVFRQDAAFGEQLALELLEGHDRDLCVLAGRIVGRHAAGDAIGSRVRQGLEMLRAADWIRREAGAAMLGSLDPAPLADDLYEELVETLEAAGTGDADHDVQQMAIWAAGELKRRRG